MDDVCEGDDPAASAGQGGQMTAADDYIDRVLEPLPRGTSMRDQIAMELRGNIAGRLESGQSVADVLRQLGDPRTLAESYLRRRASRQRHLPAARAREADRRGCGRGAADVVHRAPDVLAGPAA